VTLKCGLEVTEVIESGTIGKLGYFLFAFHSNMAVSVAILETLSVKEWPDLEIWVWSR